MEMGFGVIPATAEIGMQFMSSSLSRGRRVYEGYRVSEGG